MVGGFEPHQRHCVVVLDQDTFILANILVQPRKTHPCLTERLLMGRKESNQTNKQILSYRKYKRHALSSRVHSASMWHGGGGGGGGGRGQCV